MPVKNQTALSVSKDTREAMNQLSIKLSAILGTRVTHSQAIHIMNAMIDIRKTPFLQVSHAAEKAIRDGGTR